MSLSAAADSTRLPSFHAVLREVTATRATRTTTPTVPHARDERDRNHQSDDDNGNHQSDDDNGHSGTRAGIDLAA